MAQLAHVDVGATPVDLTDGLAAGCYVAQAGGDPPAAGVLYATASSAPSDTEDFFAARAGEYFTFTVGGTPTWAVSDTPGLVVALALALVPS